MKRIFEIFGRCDSKNVPQVLKGSEIIPIFRLRSSFSETYDFLLKPLLPHIVDFSSSVAIKSDENSPKKFLQGAYMG